MNSEARNFLVFRWQDVAGTIKPQLRMNAARETLTRCGPPLSRTTPLARGSAHVYGIIDRHTTRLGD